MGPIMAFEIHEMHNMVQPSCTGGYKYSQKIPLECAEPSSLLAIYHLDLAGVFFLNGVGLKCTGLFIKHNFS